MEKMDRAGWPIEECRRCFGSGEHSYNQRHGKVCYGCGGSGWTYTARAKKERTALRARIKEMRATPIEEVRVGDILEASYGVLGYTTAIVESIEHVVKTPEQRAAGEWFGKTSVNDVTTEYFERYILRFKPKVINGRLLQINSITVHEGYTAHRVNDRFAEDELTAAAKKAAQAVAK